MSLYQIKQSTTAYPLVFLMIDSSDGVSGKTGLSPTVKLSKAGGTGAAPSGAVTEIDATNLPGWYKVAGNATDSGTLGSLALHAAASGANPSDAMYEVVSYDPQDGVHLGISALPNTACATNGSLITNGTGTAQLSVTAGIVGDTAGTTTLLSRLTSARAGYLDNLNVGGNVASHADIAAINQSASKHILIQTVGQYAGGEVYTVEIDTFNAATGALVNADTTPTLAATGAVSGSLSSNLGSVTNPATGVYRATYTPGATPTLEQIRFDGSATISSSTFTLSCYTQTVDSPTATFTSTDKSNLTAIFNKLPTNSIADETLLLAAIGSPAQASNLSSLQSHGDSTWATATGFATPGAQMDFVNAPNATAINAIQSGLATSSAVGSPAQASNLATLTTTVGAAGGGLTAVASQVMASSVDTGISLAKLGEMLAAMMCGKTSVVDSGGISTITLLKRDGTTVSFRVPANDSDNNRATTGALS